MADGVDLMAAKIAIQERDAHPDGRVRVFAFVSIPPKTTGWSKTRKATYDWVADRLDGLFVLRGSNAHTCCQERIRLMVDYSSALIAVYDHTQSGGTRDTLDYAQAIAPSRLDGFEIVILDPRGCLQRRPRLADEQLHRQILAAQDRDRKLKAKQYLELQEAKAARQAKIAAAMAAVKPWAGE